MRDNRWLAKRLFQIWQRYFPDIELKNNIFIRFGKPAKTQLGRIKFGRRKPARNRYAISVAGGENPNTFIIVNGLFKNEKIPEFVVDATLVHEFCHYAHGFYSPHPKLHKYPHKGGVIRKELEKRGLSELFKLERKWLKLNWSSHIRNSYISKN